jgi:hypothetical protein
VRIEGKFKTNFFPLKLTRGSGNEVPQSSILDPRRFSSHTFQSAFHFPATTYCLLFFHCLLHPAGAFLIAILLFNLTALLIEVKGLFLGTSLLGMEYNLKAVSGKVFMVA